MKGETERRTVHGESIEVRKSGDGKTRIRGYGAVFNSFSEDLGGFKEIIRPGAFRNALAEGQDVRGLFNHDPNQVLGRTEARTMTLREDSHGLVYEIDVPDTQVGRDLVTTITRGDVSGSSFSFRVRENGDEWRDEQGRSIRELRDVDLYDVGPVVFPAYPATVAEATKRSLEAFQTEQARQRRTYANDPATREAEMLMDSHS